MWIKRDMGFVTPCLEKVQTVTPLHREPNQNMPTNCIVLPEANR